MNDTNQLRNPQAEHEVLTACINDENIYTTLRGLLSEDLFTDADCKKLFSIMVRFEKEGKIPNLTEVTMYLVSDGIDVTRFISTGYSSYSVTKQKIDGLIDLSMKRSLYTLCCKGINIATNPASDSSEFQQLLADFKQNMKDDTSDVLSFSDTVKSLQNSVACNKNGTGERGMLTGLHVFDIRYGLHQGDLVIIAGETSMGKSTLATTIARNMAIERIPVAYYSLEMGANQLTARIVARDTQIASSRLLYDKLSDSEYDRFYDASSVMEQLPIYFDENNKTSFPKMCNSIRAMVRKRGVKVVFIDYLQILANSSSTNNREQLIGDMARELKVIAVECNVCVIALSQLSRDNVNHEPNLNRLRGSGQIAEAADLVVFVYRPYIYGVERFPDGTPTVNAAQVIIDKGRNIGLAKEVVSFNADLTFFSDYVKTENKETTTRTDAPWNRNEEENLPF